MENPFQEENGSYSIHTQQKSTCIDTQSISWIVDIGGSQRGIPVDHGSALKKHEICQCQRLARKGDQNIQDQFK